MSIESKKEYLLFFRGPGWTKELTPEQLQAVMDKGREWFESLAARGIAKAGHPLENAGRVVTGASGRVVADGPFTESKEVVGGYFMIVAESLDEAAEIAKGFPALEYGASVEVRQIADVCPAMRELEHTPAACAMA